MAADKPALKTFVKETARSVTGDSRSHIEIISDIWMTMKFSVKENPAIEPTYCRSSLPREVLWVTR
jgi:hypothetical protein